MEAKQITQIAKLEAKVRKLSADFRQTREFASIETEHEEVPEISLDMKDYLILGGITNSGILITGKSGGGKTHLAIMATNAMHGTGKICNKTITPGMNEEAFIDIDFGKIKDGSTLKEAMQETPILTNPGVILNEVNRAPGPIQNILIPYLEFEFNIKGLGFPVGIEMPDGKRYQYRILTINEGPEYKGTAQMDKAVRDRMIIEIPIDHFKPTKSDLQSMIRGRKSSGIHVQESKESLTETVLDLYKSISDIPLAPATVQFIVYLSGLSNCIKSLTGSKEGIAFTLDMCKGCKHAATKENMCGNVYAPTNRSLINIQNVAKGVAALRAYKVLQRMLARAESDSKKKRTLNEFMQSDYLKNLTVTMNDVMACAPFILYSKMQINDQWVQKNYQGSKFLAVEDVVESAYQSFMTFYKEQNKVLARYMVSKDQEGLRKFMQKYATEADPWMANIKDFENKDDQIEQRPDEAELISGYNGC